MIMKYTIGGSLYDLIYQLFSDMGAANVGAGLIIACFYNVMGGDIVVVLITSYFTGLSTSVAVRALGSPPIPQSPKLMSTLLLPLILGFPAFALTLWALNYLLVATN